MSGRARLVFVALAAVVEASSVTPVQKVTELLENLAKKVEQEGKDEAAAYDKYACFCKEQADDKQYAIEKSNKTIITLSDKIQKLADEIADLDDEIQHLGQDVIRLDGEMDQKKQARDAGHATFLTNVADAKGALDAVQRAIQALEDSKKAQMGKAELEAAALAQVGRFAEVALTQRAHLSESAISQLGSLASATKPGQSYTYKYRSNDIIATLQGLREMFNNRKLGLEDDEFKAQSAYELIRQDLQNQKKFTIKAQTEAQQERAKKEEEKEAKTLDKNNEQRDKASDEAFLGVLEGNCEEAARLWDQRSQTRFDELHAIGLAIESLKTGVAPNYQANKKLVGLQKKSEVKGHWVYVEAAPAPMSFLQVSGASLRGSSRAGESTQAQIAGKVHELLVRSAAKLKSPFLSVAALKVHAVEDHFVKVRQIIKDLIQHLEDQASAEETHKSWCDREMSAAVAKRDEQQGDVEDLEGVKSVHLSDRVQLKSEIADLTKQIAENKKALNEATILRQDENKENMKTLDDAEAGREAVEFALNTLKDFYENAALLQRSAYVPPNSDREGLTVADRAPEVFDTEYKGSQDASKGIIGMLEVILADFRRTDGAVSDAEHEAQDRFETFESENTQDTNNKQDSVDFKNGEVSDIDDDLVDINDHLQSANDNHAAANTELDKLRSMCIAGVETYEERVAQRNREIEALKEAHGILEDWQK